MEQDTNNCKTALQTTITLAYGDVTFGPQMVKNRTNVYIGHTVQACRSLCCAVHHLVGLCLL